MMLVGVLGLLVCALAIACVDADKRCNYTLLSMFQARVVCVLAMAGFIIGTSILVPLILGP